MSARFEYEHPIPIRSSSLQSVHTMNLSTLVDTLVVRIESLDIEHELDRLARHARVGNPQVIERMATLHGTTPVHEAQRVAAIQLRVLEGLGAHLRWLEAVIVDPELNPCVRAGLAGVLISLSTESELLPMVDSQAAVLLEPALLLHGLLANLRPWLPGAAATVEPAELDEPTIEPEPVIELLRLGLPDYLLPILRRRFEGLWTLFHRLRQRERSEGRELARRLFANPRELEQVIREPSFTLIMVPPAPVWPPTHHDEPAKVEPLRSQVVEALEL